MLVKPPPAAVQRSLFDILPDKPLTTPGESRARYGRIAEEIACGVLGLDDIPNSGSHGCVFDAWGHGHYVEVKSCRETSSVPLYTWRQQKDKASGVPLAYALVIHRCGKCVTLGDAWRSMVSTVKTILVLPAAVMHRLTEGQPVHQLVAAVAGSRMGYERAGYCSGYQLVSIRSVLDEPFSLPFRRETAIHGLTVSASVRFHHSMTPWR